jgi:hypothetical protein
VLKASAGRARQSTDRRSERGCQRASHPTRPQTDLLLARRK